MRYITVTRQVYLMARSCRGMRRYLGSPSFHKFPIHPRPRQLASWGLTTSPPPSSFLLYYIFSHFASCYSTSHDSITFEYPRKFETSYRINTGIREFSALDRYSYPGVWPVPLDWAFHAKCVRETRYRNISTYMFIYIYIYITM